MIGQSVVQKKGSQKRYCQAFKWKRVSRSADGDDDGLTRVKQMRRMRKKS